MTRPDKFQRRATPKLKLYHTLLRPGFLKRLHASTLEAVETRGALRVLALVSFLESCIFPIAPDALIVPVVLARRAQAWVMASVATIASVAGSYAGYVLGMLLYLIATPLTRLLYGDDDVFAIYSVHYQEWGFWVVALIGLTPFPYKAANIASGALTLDPVIFGAASILSRGAQFFLVTAILYWGGSGALQTVKQNFDIIKKAVPVLFIVGFIAIKFIS